jgi:predicted RNA-binding Zn ribbon-like protein
MMSARAEDGPVLDERDLAFRFLAGRQSLALTATVGERWRRSFERLRTPSDLEAWFAQVGPPFRRVAVSNEHLEAARKLRESIYRAARARTEGLQIPRADVAVINKFARLPAPAPQLHAGEIAWKSSNGAAAALSLVARDAVDLLGGALSGRIRECASADCALLFLDSSRPGRRRWCSSETCGSRARSAAYRDRQPKRA